MLALARSSCRRPTAFLGAARYTTAARPPLKLAVIGSGPSGFYAASRVLNLLPANTPEGASVQVDMYERLPTPYGLARYGVAPDHPEVKNCQHKFDEMSSDPRFTFLGNVSVGTTAGSPAPGASNPHLPHYQYPHAVHVPLSDLTPHYNAIVFSYGASFSNPLGTVPGSSASEAPLRGVLPALAFVAWYNGHPAYADLDVDLSKVVNVDVVGQGNVALDVARILLRPVDTLVHTDLPDNILHALSKSAVKTVRAVGRRGPGQVAFTTKELREMVTLGCAYPGVDPELMAQAQKAAKGDRMRTRQLALMETVVPPHDGDGGRTFELDFLKSPKAFLPAGTEGEAAGRVGGVEWDVNVLESKDAPDGGKPIVSAKRTGETVTSKADLVVESVGYRSAPLEGLPFDLGRGRVHNDAGRVMVADGSGALVPGAYAAGWAASGPVGVIASTMQGAYGLVETLLGDWESDAWSNRAASSQLALPGVPETGRPDAVTRGLKEGSVVDMGAWLKIDAAERELGKRKGREEREKFRTVDEMLSVL